MCIKWMYTLKSYIVNMWKFRTRRQLALVLTFVAVSFVIISALELLLSYFVYYAYDTTCVYSYVFREPLPKEELGDIVEKLQGSFGETEGTIQLYAPYNYDMIGPVIGTNRFLHGTLLWNARGISQPNMDERLAWMPEYMWDVQKSLEFPYKTIWIEGNAYDFAGIYSPFSKLKEGLPRSNARPEIQVQNGQQRQNLPTILNEQNDESENENTFDATIITYEKTAITIPLAAFVKDGLPAMGIAVCYKNPPSNSAFQTLKETLSPYTVRQVERQPSFSFRGLAAIMSVICVAATLLALILSSFGYYRELMNRRQWIQVWWICGARQSSIRRIINAELLGLISIGYALAVWPANMAVRLDPEPTILTGTELLIVWGIYTLLTIAIYSLATRRAVRKITQTNAFSEV